MRKNSQLFFICGNLYFNFLSRAFICALIYYNVPPFSLLFLPSVFMFYNTFAYQRITKKFPIYSKIIPDIFCIYCKKVYFCIRLARGAKPFLSLTCWKRGLPAKLLNKKTSQKIWFQCLKVLIFAFRFANRRRFFLRRFFSFRKRAVR